MLPNPVAEISVRFSVRSPKSRQSVFGQIAPKQSAEYCARNAGRQIAIRTSTSKRHKVFEFYRHQLVDVTITTVDELIEKPRALLAFLSRHWPFPRVCTRLNHGARPPPGFFVVRVLTTNLIR
jgi:hypothetical protein